MKSNNTIKIITIIFIFILSCSIYTPISNAGATIIDEGAGFLKASENESLSINETALKNASNHVYNILLAMGIFIAVIIAMVLGIQFMMASAGEKAKVKEAIIPFVIGCIVVFGAFAIWKIFVTIGQNAESTVVSVYLQNGYYNLLV